MTFEEAKEIFINRGYEQVDGGSIYNADRWRQSVIVISDWLQQEPCEDAINRQEITEYLQRIVAASDTNNQYNEGFVDGIEFCITNISTIPSVAPLPKIGHWIGDKCSECGEERAWYGNNPPYCPDCGTKIEAMEVESEE